MNEMERAAVKAAIEALDAAWDYDAERGLRDGRGGSEYIRTSPAVILTDMLEGNRLTSAAPPAYLS